MFGKKAQITIPTTPKAMVVYHTSLKLSAKANLEARAESARTWPVTPGIFEAAAPPFGEVIAEGK